MLLFQITIWDGGILDQSHVITKQVGWLSDRDAKAMKHVAECYGLLCGHAASMEFGLVGR